MTPWRTHPPRYRRDPADAHPPMDYPPYKSTQLRHPSSRWSTCRTRLPRSPGRSCSRLRSARPTDLTVQHDGEPIGERIIVSGRVYDTEGKPLRGTLVEIWQANAAGRYAHMGTAGRRRSTPTSPAPAAA